MMTVSSKSEVTSTLDFPSIGILFEDEHVVIVDKPSNLLTTPGRGPDKQDCLYHRLLLNYPNARVVHRLDMATSGIVIFALSHPVQVAMGHLFEKRLMEKTYIAVVDGKLDKAEGDINLPLVCDWDNRPIQKVCHETGKAAQTHYRVLAYDEQKQNSRVVLEPLTGRSHQLRVHMMALGHPILGDVFYHPGFSGVESARLLLHAHQIQFTHPVTQEAITVTSDLPF